MQKSHSYLGLRSLFTATLILHIASFYQVAAPAYAEGLVLASRKLMAFVGLSTLGLLLEFILVIACWTKAVVRIDSWITRICEWLANIGWINVITYALSAAALTYLVYGTTLGLTPPGRITIIALFWTVALGGCLLLKAWSVPRHASLHLPWINYLAISVLFTAFVYRITSFFPDISTYPFTLTWSETSRYYYASLFFSKHIYGFAIPSSVLHPTRYLMQAVPFLLPGSPLWLHRAWQVFLWISVTLVTSLVIIRRFAINNHLWKWLACLWIFLFLLIGPVYYHLQVPVIIICLGFNRARFRTPWKREFVSLVSVLVASLWAGISRVNWYPVPGMLAGALWFLEIPVLTTSHSESSSSTDQKVGYSIKSILIYCLKPAIWFVLGFSTAIAAQALYIYWSGNPASQFTSSFSSGLLWYRLWPNSTYLIGILPGILLLSLPMFMLIWLRLSQPLENGPFWRSIHYIRILGLAAILIVLLITGLIVSVKIGGGSNLHNLDSYMVILLVVTAGFFFRKVVPDRSTMDPVNFQYGFQVSQNDFPGLRPGILSRLAMAVSLVTVVFFSILGRGPISDLPDQKSVEKAFKEINRQIGNARQSGGEVLFLSNRQLITFKDILGIRMVPDYERVFLMEMAMAGNSDYLDRFHQDLRNHRFSLIVSEPLFLRQKDENEIFGEENNAWVQNVSQYVLCYYQEDRRARAVNIQFFVPNPQPVDCP